MTLGEYAAFGTFGVAIIGLVSGIAYRINGMINTVERDSGDKRARIYERLDEVKNTNKKEFVGKDICNIQHKQITDALSEIRTDVKILIQNGKSK